MMQTIALIGYDIGLLFARWSILASIYFLIGVLTCMQTIPSEDLLTTVASRTTPFTPSTTTETSTTTTTTIAPACGPYPSDGDTHATIFYSSAPHIVGSTATKFCKTGYQNNGVNQVTCQSSLTWSPTFSLCTLACPSLQSLVVNSPFLPTSTGTFPVTHVPYTVMSVPGGYKVQCFCTLGSLCNLDIYTNPYPNGVFDGSLFSNTLTITSNLLTCLPNGQWSGESSSRIFFTSNPTTHYALEAPGGIFDKISCGYQP